MAIKHIAKYRAQVTGNTEQEELNLLKMRAARSNGGLFKTNGYEKYLWKKSKNMLEGEY